MKGLVVLALVMLGAAWVTTGERVKDSIVLRVFNKDFRMSSANMHALLKKVNLESHGFQKQVVTKLSRQPGSSPTKTEYTRTVYYYKIVPCNKAHEVGEELDRLLSGVLGKKVIRKMKKDLSSKKMEDPNRKCRAGIEIHYKNQQFCGIQTKQDGPVKRGFRSPCLWCGVCVNIAEIQK